MNANINEYAMAQKEFSNQGRLDVAFVRIDGQNASGFGQVAEIIIIMEDDILRGRSDDEELEIPFNISNVRIINNKGEMVPSIDGSPVGILIDSIGVNTHHPFFKDQVFIYSNPVKRGARIYLKSDLEISQV